MRLTELGEFLRDERVRRGLSVDEIATRLKITSRVVRAIEEGDLSSLPHAVYACGFIRAYAVLLGVDDEDVRPVLQELVEAEENTNASPSSPVPPQHHARRKSWALPFILVVCVVAFAVLWHQRGQMESTMSRLFVDAATSATPSVAPALPEDAARAAESTGAAKDSTPAGTATTPTTPSVSPAAPSSTAAAPATTPATVTPGAPAQATRQDTSGIPMSPEGTPSLPPTPSNLDADSPQGAPLPQGQAPAQSSGTVSIASSGGQTSVPPQTKTYQIIVTGLAECWVHSAADGTDVRQFSLKKGEIFALSFEKKLTLKLGNAGGVRIKFNGEELPPPGTPGQVKTLVFPPAG